MTYTPQTQCPCGAAKLKRAAGCPQCLEIARPWTDELARVHDEVLGVEDVFRRNLDETPTLRLEQACQSVMEWLSVAANALGQALGVLDKANVPVPRPAPETQAQKQGGGKRGRREALWRCRHCEALVWESERAEHLYYGHRYRVLAEDGAMLGHHYAAPGDAPGNGSQLDPVLV